MCGSNQVLIKHDKTAPLYQELCVLIEKPENDSTVNLIYLILIK